MQAELRRHRIGLAYAFLGVFLFSISIPATKLAVSGFHPLVTAMARPSVAAAVAIPLLLINRIPLPPRHLWRQFAFTTAGAVFGWPILIALALARSSSAHVSVIAAFMPLMTALIAVMRGHEKVPKQFWVAAVVGTAALTGFAMSRSASGELDLVADLLVVGAVIASSWCYVEGAGLTREMPGWQVISWVVVLATPVTLPAAFIAQALLPMGAISTQAWLGLLYICLVSMYFGFWAWYRGLNLAGVTYGSNVQQLQALLTLIWSVAFLHESVNTATVVTAIAVVASVLWAQRARQLPAT